MRTQLLTVFVLIFVFAISCDVEELLKTAQEPEVSNIFSDADGFVVEPLQQTKFWVNASDPDGGTVTYQWSASGGEYLSNRQNDTLVWRAPVTGGVYTISVKVANSEKDVTRSRDVTVPSYNAPQVEITAPPNNQYVVQENPVVVSASAFSENGIFRVDFLVRDSLVESKSGAGNTNFEFNWTVKEEAGPVELKVSATANQTGLVGSDSILVNVEGVIPGKLNVQTK
jgi:hypothetical protein